MPRLDVGVRWRILGQGERLTQQLPRHRLGQKQPCRMALSDRLIKIQHGSFSPDGKESPYAYSRIPYARRLGRSCYLQGRCAITGFSHLKHLTCKTFNLKICLANRRRVAGTTSQLNLSSRMGSSVPSRSCPPRTLRGAWPALSCWRWH